MQISRTMHRMRWLAYLCFILLGLFHYNLHSQSTPQNATISGRVLDLKTEQRIANASVSLPDQKLNAVTNSDGDFVLADVRPGKIELQITTVGYGLTKKNLDVAGGSSTDLEVYLGQEALKETQQITVHAGPFDPVDPDAATQNTLDNSEIQSLSTVLANDPFRAVQNLPGVSGNQDFYGQFAVRGAGSPTLESSSMVSLSSSDLLRCAIGAYGRITSSYARPSRW
jgi:hypothetical protein